MRRQGGRQAGNLPVLLFLCQPRDRNKTRREENACIIPMCVSALYAVLCVWRQTGDEKVKKAGTGRTMCVCELSGRPEKGKPDMCMMTLLISMSVYYYY